MLTHHITLRTSTKDHDDARVSTDNHHPLRSEMHWIEPAKKAARKAGRFRELLAYGLWLFLPSPCALVYKYVCARQNIVLGLHNDPRMLMTLQLHEETLKRGKIKVVGSGIAFRFQKCDHYRLVITCQDHYEQLPLDEWEMRDVEHQALDNYFKNMECPGWKRNQQRNLNTTFCFVVFVRGLPIWHSYSSHWAWLCSTWGAPCKSFVQTQTVGSWKIQTVAAESPRIHSPKTGQHSLKTGQHRTQEGPT